MKKKFNAHQMLAIQASERIMSVLSILGSLFIIATFLRWHYFRKPINRLVFYASFGNMMANVATLISTSALPTDPHHVSSLCEFQGVLIQWCVVPPLETLYANVNRFMMADSLWVFCMALNVMLVFFHGYNSRQLRRLEKWYLLFSYGLPGTSALVYVILDHTGPKQIIGAATVRVPGHRSCKDTNVIDLVLGLVRGRMVAHCLLLRSCLGGYRLHPRHLRRHRAPNIQETRPASLLLSAGS